MLAKQKRYQNNQNAVEDAVRNRKDSE